MCDDGEPSLARTDFPLLPLRLVGNEGVEYIKQKKNTSRAEFSPNNKTQ